MDGENCFAYKNGKCNALSVKKCDCEGCSFFKTRKQIQEGQWRVFRKINSLDPALKKNIMDLYYGGNMSLLEVRR